MEISYNSDASQDIVGALARRNNLSLDALSEFAETRVSEFEGFTHITKHYVNADYEKNEQNVISLISSEKELITTKKTVLTSRVKIEKEIEQKNIKLREAKTGTFLRAVIRNKWFWTLSALNCLYMGPWTFITWVLVRGRKVDLTDMIGGILQYFASYVKGLPGLDFSVMLIAGLGWTAFFSAIYISMYNYNHLTKASPNWKRKEAWGVACLVLIEVILTISSAFHASNASETNMKLYNSSLILIILDALPLVASWLLWHFLIYKSWIVNIRVKAAKTSGEIYLVEIQESLDKAKSKKIELEKEEERIKISEVVNKKNKKILSDTILNYKTADRGIIIEVTKEKYAVIGVGQKWLQASVDVLNIRGEQYKIRDYEIALKNVIKRVCEHLDKQAKECYDFVEKYNEKSNKLIKILNAEFVPAPINTTSLLPIVLILFGFLFSSCASSTILNQKTDSDYLNVLVSVDLSDRFLQDTDSKFLPVKQDVETIEIAYASWEQNILNSYEEGIDVTMVEGAFSVIPVPLPHEIRREISALGYCLELSSLPIAKRWEYLEPYKDSVMDHSNLLYRTALQYKPMGADVWSFFRDLPTYLKTSKDSIRWHNKVILLTDGYPYMEDKLKKLRKSNSYQRDYLEEADMDLLRKSNNWEEVYKKKNMGFLPIGKSYSNLDVLVIGINEPANLQGNATELSIIKRYWSDFFEGMGVEHYSFIRLNTPGSENIIKEFIKS